MNPSSITPSVMAPTPVSLPYFDTILSQIDLGDTDMQQVFGRHVHWGYWEHPNQADGSVQDFSVAAEHLCQKVYQTAEINTGDRVLDVGCGFGGTVASLNENFQDLQLVGLNIDPRQLARARQEIHPQGTNQIEFVEGNACQLPFTDGEFDKVLAVECIFHFPSRVDFFHEARRVLRTGGRLAISDFIPVSIPAPVRNLLLKFTNPTIGHTYGQVDSQFVLADYQNLAKASGFTLVSRLDITRHTLPTYPLICQIFQQVGNSDAVNATKLIGQFSRLGLLRYCVLGFVVQ
ncbi:MAG: class I SAM-dependent methyltransferase [Microcoleaceae cyanobacterium]